MGLTSLQVCMDSLSSDWLQGTIHEDSGIDCSSPSGDILACSRPLMERRLRPPNDQALKCPRCDSTHTKFCYYNNYSLSQPRYFCKTCRRYWTKGGTLRNIPVGGGCRKNKKVAKKGNNNEVNSNPNSVNSGGSSVHFHHHNPTDLHLSFPPEVQLSHINAFIGGGSPNFMLENPKLEAIGGSSSRNYDFMGNGDHLGMINGLNHNGLAPINYHNLCNSPFGMSGLDGANGAFMDTCQRLMLPYDQIQHQPNDHDLCDSIDVKPNPKLLALEWQDQGCSDNGYLNNSWAGIMNGYGSSTTNPLV